MPEDEEAFHILYVEDDDDAYETWSDRLLSIDTHRFAGNNRHKPTLERAKNQKEALAKVESSGARGFDLIVLDLHYPEDAEGEADHTSFAGLKWLPELSQRLPDTTIVVFTAHSIDRSVQDAVTELLQDGLHEFIPKGTSWAEMELRFRFAWKFAHHTRHRQLLQRETAELLRSRVSQIYLYDADRTVTQNINLIESVGAELARMGGEGMDLAERLRGQLKTLGDELKSILRGASGRKSEPKTEENLSAWLRDSLYWYFSEYRRNNVRLDWRTEPAVTVRSHIDDVRVVVHELLQNALSSIVCSERLDGRTVVSVSRRSHQVEIVVEDNGIGFAEEDLASGRVFARDYSQWPKPEARIVDHQGMGLNVAAVLINNLGGAIKAENVNASDRSQGARVTLTVLDLEESSQ